MSRWVVGVDFGRQSDRTAVAAVEIVPAEPGEDGRRRKPFLDLRFLHRMPVGMPYPEQCGWLAGLMTHTGALIGADLIVDATGVGVAVADSLREQYSRGFTELTITSGGRVVEDGRRLSVPKRDLVSRLAVVMQARRLRVARGLADGEALFDELGNFGVSITDAGTDTYGARSGHDDLVLATSYAVWLADRPSSAQAWTDYVRELSQPQAARPVPGRPQSRMLPQGWH